MDLVPEAPSCPCSPRPLRLVRLRPPRHPQPLPRMRRGPREGGGRMKSKLFKLAARVSTVLCVLALALSFRSHWRGDRVRYVHENWTASLASDDGTLRLAVTAPSAF